jgi:hypothetical protein
MVWEVPPPPLGERGRGMIAPSGSVNARETCDQMKREIFSLRAGLKMV